MSKILSLLVAGALLSTTYAYAQDFEILENPFEMSTTGCAPFENQPFETKDFVLGFQTHLKNLSTDPMDSIQVEWTYLHNLTVEPSGWKLTGICDNDLCRSEDGAWYTGNTEIGKKFDNTHNMLLELNVFAPTNGLDGVGTYHVEVKTANQTDTAVFILTKTPLGISKTLINNKSVAIYPNPATDVLNIYTDNKLKVNQISVYNLIGKEMITQDRSSNQEVTTLNISEFAQGIYIIRFNDENGNVVATRKFTKK